MLTKRAERSPSRQESSQPHPSDSPVRSATSRMEEDFSSPAKAETASPILGAFQVDEDGNVKMSGQTYIESVDREARRLLRRGHPSELEVESIRRTGRINSLLLNLLGVSVGGIITITATLFGTNLTPEEISVMKALLTILVISAIGLSIALVYSDSAMDQLKEKIRTKSDVDQMDRILPKSIHEKIASPSVEQKADQG